MYFSQGCPIKSHFTIPSVKRLKCDMLLSTAMVSLATHHLIVYTCKEASYSYTCILYTALKVLSIEIASPPEPVDLPTIAIQSVYDYRRGYFGHARLTITWENPPSMLPYCYCSCAVTMFVCSEQIQLTSVTTHLRWLALQTVG